MSIELLKNIIDENIIQKYEGKISASIQIDASETGESHKVLNSCAGMVVAYGFDCSWKEKQKNNVTVIRMADKYSRKVS
jgi:hypothetical protein